MYSNAVATNPIANTYQIPHNKYHNNVNNKELGKKQRAPAALQPSEQQ